MYCWVWEGLRVARLGLTLVEGEVEVVRSMVAWAVCVGSAMLAIARVTVCCKLMVAGAVYTPFVIVPVWGARVHVTAVADAGAPPIVTLNCADWPPVRVVEEGANATLAAGVRVTVPLEVLVGSAELAAVTITVCWLLTVAGAE
jgi:hypothetical protein